MGKGVLGANMAVFACWVPIVSIIGICFPGIFLGGDVVRKLNERGTKDHWFNRIRVGAFAYLLLLFSVPVIGALASHS
jgi:hypothetical protein